MPPGLQAAGVTGGFSVNIDSREEVRSFYNAIYPTSDGIPIDSSAIVTNCFAGTNSTAFVEAELRRINWLRALAGMPASVTFEPTNSAKAQQAALIMAANDALSPTPPPSWTCYTVDGATGADNSLLSLGVNGPQAIITRYMNQSGAAGSRRMVLYPPTQVMAVGDMPPQSPHSAANALWVFDINRPRPATRNRFVSWPPPGFTPYQLAFSGWSFSYTNANFTAAKVTMRSNNVNISSVALQTVVNGFGDNTLVWEPTNFFTGRPTTDIVYSVTISNVVINGGSSNFSYNVTVFDPAIRGADAFPPVVAGTNQPMIGQNNAYTFNAVSNASGYEWRQVQRLPFNLTDGAEAGLDHFTVTASTNLYPIIVSDVVASGTHAFHLAMPTLTDQVLTLTNLFYGGTNSMLTFKSRLGIATVTQVAKVQASLDEGGSWTDLYTQAGTGGSGESSFVARSVPLGTLAGNSFRLRFNYAFTGGSAFPQTSAGVGWYIDDIVLTNIEQLANPVITSTAVTTFTFNPPQAGNYNLDVRAILYTQFPLEWGPAKLVTAVGGYSLQFTGNGHVQIAHTNELNVFPMTLTAWITTTNQIVNAEIGIINKYLANSFNGYNLFLSAGHLRAWYFKDAANNVFTGGEGLDGGFVADGYWHHIAFTVDASEGRLYVDGQLKQTTAWTGTAGAPTTTEPLRLGLYPGVVASSSNAFQGLLDEVQIWNVARSQAQIQTGEFLPLTGTEANLVAYYPFSEAPGAVTTADVATTLAGVNTGYISNTVARIASSALAGITQTVLTNSQAQLNFNLLFGPPGVFSLQRVGAVAGTWSNDTAAVLTTNIPGLSYLFTTPTNTGNQFFYRVRIQ